MKLKVNRQLSGGLYSVDFSVGDFTTDEVKKMESFGVPAIDLVGGGPHIHTAMRIPLNRIMPSFRAHFDSEEAAKAYELKVVMQIREEMKRLRQLTDGFSSTQEVDL